VCRNLLIYLGYPLQRKVMTVFHYGLKPTGFLMLGRSETTSAHPDLFALVDKKQKIYARKPVVLTGHLDFGGVVPVVPSGIERPRPPRVVRAVRDDVTGTEMNKLILDRYGPPGVLVDTDFRIVRTRGRTGRYLELATGEAKLDLLQMVREGLLYGLRTALREARSRGIHVRKEGLHVRSNGETRLVNVDVSPIASDGDRRFLVLFEEQGPAKPTAAERAAARRRAGKAPRASETVKRLETELTANREYLQSIIEDLEAANEELQSANEEILSSNEELQSTNEELDTAREELQSTNEELNTLNEELRSRNDELSRANSDLVNLLASIQVAVLMVSTDLRIRRFTPAAERILNLIAGDIGRPIAHIKPNINCPNLEELIADSIDSMAVCEREVTDSQGNLYALRIRPYKSGDNRIDGAVLTLLDLSLARVNREFGEAVMNSVSEPILLLDDRLEVLRANRAFTETFRVAAKTVEGMAVHEMGGEGVWDIPSLRTLLAETLAHRKKTEVVTLEHEFPEIGKRRMAVDARRIEGGSAGSGLMLLIMHDLTDPSDAEA
jgi:two-component system CheB/CheR fusion protein